VGGVWVVATHKFKHQRLQILGAIVVQTTCVGVLSTATIDNPVKSVVLTCLVSFCVTIIMINCFVLIGFGISNQDDMYEPKSPPAAISKFPLIISSGTAAGLAGTARLMCGAVAVAIFSNITNNKYGNTLLGAVASRVQGLGFPSEMLPQLAAAARLNTPAAYETVPGATPLVIIAATYANKEAYLDGARLAYQVALAFGLVGCICAWFIPSIDQRKLNTRTVAVQQKDQQHLQEKDMKRFMDSA
jgi:hypothetical protein